MPKVAYRLCIEGCPVEWVSDVAYETTVADGRERLAGLEVAGLQIREDLSLKDPISSVSGMTITIKHARALTELIKSAQPVSNLAASCTATEPETTKTVSVDIGSEFTASSVYHIGTEAFHVESIASNDLTVTGCYWDTLKQNHYIAKDLPELNGATVIYDRPPTLEGRRAYLFRYENGEASDGLRLYNTDPAPDNYGEAILTTDELIWRGIVAEPPALGDDGLSVKIRIDSIMSILNQQIGTDATGYITGIYRPYTSCCAIKVWCDDEAPSHAAYIPWTSPITKRISGYWATTKEFAVAIQAKLDDLVDEQSYPLFTAIELIEEEEQYAILLTMSTTYPITIENIHFVFIDNALGCAIPSSLEWLNVTGPGAPTTTSETNPAPIGRWDRDNVVSVAYRQKVALAATGGIWLPQDFRVDTLLPSESQLPQNWINTPKINRTTYRSLVKDADTTYPKNRIYANPDFISRLVVGDIIEIKNTVETDISPEYVTINALDTNDLYFEHDQTPERFFQAGSNATHSLGYRSTFLDGNTQLKVVSDQVDGDIDDFVRTIKIASVKANNGANPFITYADVYDTEDIPDTLTYDYYKNRTYRIIDKTVFRDLLKEELRLIGYYACLDSNGKIAFKSLTNSITPSVAITDNHIARGTISWERNTQGIVSIIKLQDKRIVQGEEKLTDCVIKDSNIAVYKNRAKGELVIKPYSIYNNRFNPLSEDGAATLADIGDKALSVLNHDYEVVKIPVISSLMGSCTVGTWVELTSSHIIDSITGVYGVTTRLAMVVGRAWDLDPAKGAQGTLTLLVYSQLTSTTRYGWAPSAFIEGAALVSGNTWDLTVTDIYFAPGGHYDIEYFKVGTTVKAVEFNSDDPAIQTGAVSVVDTVDYNTIRVVFDAAAPWGASFTGEWILELYGFSADTTVKRFIHIAGTDHKVFSDTEPSFKVV